VSKVDLKLSRRSLRYTGSFEGCAWYCLWWQCIFI